MNFGGVSIIFSCEKLNIFSSKRSYHLAIKGYFIARLVSLSHKAEENNSMPDEMLYGRAGYLHALLFTNKYLGDDLIHPRVIRRVSIYINF